jgi:hypothetical protein
MDNVSALNRPIHFTIDGRAYTTTDRKQPARDVLRLGRLDPAHFDLGELKGNRPQPVRYSDETIVEIHDKSRFVSIRHSADVA